MNGIEYEQRAVAFIDILGFKNVVNESISSPESLKYLNELIQLLESSVPNLNRQVSPDVSSNLIPKHIYISDCIIISAPLSDPCTPNYCGLGAVVMRAIQISQMILKLEYAVNGGIAVGEVWHTSKNIVGPAYQEAYRLVQDNRLPCIVLSHDASDHWKNNNHNSQSTMCLAIRNRYVVNPFEASYIPRNEKYGVINRTLDDYQKTIDRHISNNLLPCKARLKWKCLSALLKDSKKAQSL